MKKSTSAALVAALLFLGPSCTDKQSVSTDAEATLPPLPAALEDGVRASIIVGEWSAGNQEASIWIEASEGAIGAYQARLQFDSEGLDLAGVVSPDEGYRVVNEEGAVQGEIRFAGFNEVGFAESEVLRVRFRTDRQLEPADLTLILEAVATLEGDEVPEARLSIQPGLWARP